MDGIKLPLASLNNYERTNPGNAGCCHQVECFKEPLEEGGRNN
ncbi:hypothetical protein [Bacillus sp. 7894-2]|nr:hypothetical protein [Bacillus sp. 7894-2]